MNSGTLFTVLANYALDRDTTLAGCEGCDSVVDAVRFTVASLAGVRSWRFRRVDVEDWIGRGAPTTIS